MNWKEPTAEQWMRLGFVALVIVGIVSTVFMLSHGLEICSK
jgi:hypothetical protein